MSRLFRVRFRQFLAWNIYTVVFSICLLVIAVLLIIVLSALFLVTVISVSLLFLCHLCVLILKHPRYLQCWRVHSLFFLTPTVRHLSVVRSYALSLAFLSSDPVVWVLPSSILRMVPSILQGGQPRCLSLWWDFNYRIWFREVFLFFWDTLFIFFFHVHLYDGVRFQNSQVLVSFLFSERSDFFFIW